MGRKFIAGVDIGGTWIRVAICPKDLKKDNIKKNIAKTPKENKFSISSTVCQMLSNLLSENNIKYDQLLGIGIASAGPLNIEKGEVFNNYTLGFEIIPLKEPIKKSFPKIPLYFINDCNAAVLGIYHFEAEDNEKENLIYISMSTGLGGGVICSGRLLLGKEGNVGEIGYSIVKSKNNTESWEGCWEEYSSGTGLQLRAINALKEGKFNGIWGLYSSGTGVQLRVINALNEGKLNAEKLLAIVNNDKSKITAKEIFQAAKIGDELSSKIVDDCIFYTKVGVGLVNNNFDCSSIYFGGAMMKDKDQIIPHLREQFQKNPIKFTINTPPRIKTTKYDDDIGLMGALAFIKYKLEKNQVVI
jgi:glucokinase